MDEKRNGTESESANGRNGGLAVTVLGIAGFLGFLLTGQMDDANASPFDVFAFVWFFTFGGIKLCLPWLLSRRDAAKRALGLGA
jgi:hypothetical protein